MGIVCEYLFNKKPCTQVQTLLSWLLNDVESGNRNLGVHRMTNPFPSLDTLCRTLRLVLPRPRDTWRLVRDPVVGQINGLPHFVGATIATNGIMVVLLGSNGRDYVIGHLQWFEHDANEAHAELSDLYDQSPFRPRSAPKRCEQLADYYTW